MDRENRFVFVQEKLSPNSLVDGLLKVKLSMMCHDDHFKSFISLKNTKEHSLSKVSVRFDMFL